MTATDVLMSEHRVIERVLGCLEAMAARCEQGQPLDVKSARQAIDFFRTFADHCHHAKEEDHLFPALEARGFPRCGGPTGVMLSEHELGRQYLRGVAAAVDGVAHAAAGATDQFVAYARAYAALLRSHIAKEDLRLFPMATQVLNAAEQAALLRSFEATEAEETRAGKHEAYLRLADELGERFGICATGGEQVHVCCHHRA